MIIIICNIFFFFFFNDTATTEIYTGWYTLSLHDALPIFRRRALTVSPVRGASPVAPRSRAAPRHDGRSEEHTSELQSPHPISYAVFCLKKKKTKKNNSNTILYHIPETNRKQKKQK